MNALRWVHRLSERLSLRSHKLCKLRLIVRVKHRNSRSTSNVDNIKLNNMGHNIWLMWILFGRTKPLWSDFSWWSSLNRWNILVCLRYCWRLPYSQQNLTDRRMRFLFIKYGPKLVEWIDPKNNTGSWYTTVRVRDFL